MLAKSPRTTRRRLLMALLLSLNVLALPPALWAGSRDNLLENGDFSESSIEPWKLETLEGARANVTVETGEHGKPALCVEVLEETAEPYYVNLYQGGNLTLDPDMTYVLKFRAKASAEVRLSANAMIMEEPWLQIWREDVPVTVEWQDFSYEVRPTERTEIGRITLGRLGQMAGKYWFAEVSLTPKR